MDNAANGFILEEIRDIAETDSVMKIYSHVKTGARFVHLENSDDNKMFSVTFRTPPADSTGVAHIMEHSVLCGSKKFPTKDPFIELNKSSLKTFLNAMTFADKTMYPVASRNVKDFYNLVDVYCDAVFNPLIYENKSIFLQEGWRYEESDSGLQINGVVYNEMKGAFSSPESVVFRKITNLLYPQNTYGYVSGGDPEHIPELTYDGFLDFHRKYYSASNSFIFAYGDLDTGEMLEFLEKNYLSGYSAVDVDSEIAPHPAVNASRDEDDYYPVSEGESTAEKTFRSCNLSGCGAEDVEKVFASDILEYILMETPASPLRKALIEKGIGKDVSGYFYDGIRQPALAFIVKQSDEEKKGLFLSTVMDTCRSLATEGIDRGLIESAINKFEFQLREGDFRGMPKGLIYNITAMKGWLYGLKPYAYLEFGRHIEGLRKKASEGYFEDLITEVILDNPHMSVFVLKPRQGLLEERNSEFRRKMALAEKQFDADQLSLMRIEKAEMETWQNTPDTREAVASLPRLLKEDISAESERIEYSMADINGVRAVIVPQAANGIIYADLYFDPEMSSPEYFSLLSRMLGAVGAAGRSYEDISTETDILFGGFGAAVGTYTSDALPEDPNPRFVVSMRFLEKNAEKALELACRILKSSDFGNKARVKEIIQEIRSSLESSIMSAGHRFALNRLGSYFSGRKLFEEKTSGKSFYEFVRELDEDFEARWDEIHANLEDTMKRVLVRTGMMAAFTCDESFGFDDARHWIDTIAEGLGESGAKPVTTVAPAKNLDEGIAIPGQVQYVARGYNFRRLGYKYTGAFQVLSNMLRYGYLWNKVRVNGGAYGVFSVFARDGVMAFCSYRDPQLEKTLDAYQGIPAYISGLDIGEAEMLDHIIGAVGELDAPLTPSMRGEKAASMILKGMTHADIQRERGEVLNCTASEIKKLSGVINDVLHASGICVVGSESVLRENSRLFAEVKNIFN